MKPKSDFWELYKHPKWQKKRLEIMARASHRCEVCEDDDSELHVHHGYYEKGLKPWEYPDDTLSCLCKRCHKFASEERVMLLRELGRVHPKFGNSFELEKMLAQWRRGVRDISRHPEDWDGIEDVLP